MKFFLIVCLAVLVFVSCARYVGPNEKYTIQDIVGASSNSTDLVSFNDVKISDGGITATPIFGDNVTGSDSRLKENWISPGKVFVTGIYPGGRASYFVKIHNGKDKDSIFSVICRNADQRENGYKNLPLHWMSIANGSPLVKAGETVTIPIYVEIPFSYKNSYQEKWQCLVSVVDTGRGGNVIIELGSKWFITTR